jgi:hypothetical protein
LGGILQGGGYYLMTLARPWTNLLGGLCVALSLVFMFRAGVISNSRNAGQLITEIHQHNQVLEKKAEEMLKVLEMLKYSGINAQKKQQVTELETDLQHWIETLMKINR